MNSALPLYAAHDGNAHDGNAHDGNAHDGNAVQARLDPGARCA
ncbi:MAG: hypothetical protein OXP09_13440 [Gammaproteobacteria bacterium]|nr:hypothetical protein [Gammaproteobacteria bacterium]MDE0366567.1 hypothetical protein [Gammaproteobacteria bacterium]